MAPPPWLPAIQRRKPFEGRVGRAGALTLRFSVGILRRSGGKGGGALPDSVASGVSVWIARPRLDRHRVLRPNAHLKALTKIP